MATVSKVFVALLAVLISSSSSSESSQSSESSDSSGVPDVQCGMGSVRCKISGGEIGCVEYCINSTSRCEGVDVDQIDICDSVSSCPSIETLVVEATETSLIINCNDGNAEEGFCGVACYDSNGVECGYNACITSGFTCSCVTGPPCAAVCTPL